MQRTGSASRTRQLLDRTHDRLGYFGENLHAFRNGFSKERGEKDNILNDKIGKRRVNYSSFILCFIQEKGCLGECLFPNHSPKLNFKLIFQHFQVNK